MATIGVWDTARLRPIWQVRNFSSVAQGLRWSSDESAAFTTLELALPSLRYRISGGDGVWEMWPLPAPDDGPPRARLMRVLSEAGLEMSGVELVDAAPSPGMPASVQSKN